MQPLIIPYNGVTPRISSHSFIAPTASIIGDVTIGDDSGIWFGCIIRGDVASISIGSNTNIQDGSVIHVTRNGGNTIIGNNITVGHRALLHGCTLQDGCFIGMGAIVLDNAIIETGGMVAAGALISQGKVIRKGELWAGVPAKLIRNLNDDEANFITTSANNYRIHADEYQKLCTPNAQ